MEPIFCTIKWAKKVPSVESSTWPLNSHNCSENYPETKPKTNKQERSVHPEWPHRRCIVLTFRRSIVRSSLVAASLVICSPHCTVLHVEFKGYCLGGVFSQSIGSFVSAAIICSWLWSTATGSFPLGYFSRFSTGLLLAMQDFTFFADITSISMGAMYLHARMYCMYSWWYIVIPVCMQYQAQTLYWSLKKNNLFTKKYF